MVAQTDLHWDPLRGPSRREYSHSNPGIPFSAKKTLIATTIVGGVIVLLLLLWAVLCRRQRSQPSATPYQCLDRKNPKVKASMQSSQPPVLPLYHKDLQIRPSRDIPDHTPLQQMTQHPHGSPLSVGLPNHISRAMKTPSKPATATDQTLPTMPAPARRSLIPDRTLTIASNLPSGIGRGQNLSSDTVMARPVFGEPMRQSHTPSLGDMQLTLDDERTPDRWSWTNSEAPPTPRMYAPSTRGSGADFVWFKRKTASPEEMRAHAQQKSRVKHVQPPIPARKPSLRRMLLKDPSRRATPQQPQ